MIFKFGRKDIVEADTYSGIVNKLREKDFSKPCFNVTYKKNYLERKNLNLLDALLLSDEKFIFLMEEKGDLVPLFRVFVYGSLKQGFGNHEVLNNPKVFKERDVWLHGYKMYKVSSFPGVVEGEGSILAEVYLVPSEVLRKLDRLEGVPIHYKRKIARTSDEMMGYIYIYNRSVKSMKQIKSGSWSYQNSNPEYYTSHFDLAPSLDESRYLTIGVNKTKNKNYQDYIEELI